MVPIVCTVIVCVFLYAVIVSVFSKKKEPAPPPPEIRLAHYRNGVGDEWWEIEKLRFPGPLFGGPEYETIEYWPYQCCNRSGAKAKDMLKSKETAERLFQEVLAEREQEKKRQEITLVGTQP